MKLIKYDYEMNLINLKYTYLFTFFIKSETIKWSVIQ